MKLHIGCFNVSLEGWHNTDVTMHIVVARIPFLAHVLHAFGLIDAQRFQQHRDGVFRKVHYLNALKKFPFPNNSIAAVYSSHMLVNFARQQALACLKEIHRVLRPDGILRIAVPDLDHWITTYNPGNPDAFLQLVYLPTTKRKQNHIHWMYNARSLRKMMEEAGFKKIMQYEMFKGECPDVERIDYRTDSIFMEGTK